MREIRSLYLIASSSVDTWLLHFLVYIELKKKTKTNDCGTIKS